MVCLVSAFGLGAVLVHDGAGGAESLASAGEGDDVSVQGELHPFEVPAEGWQTVRPFLRDTTYALDVEGFAGLVLVTGLESGMAEETVVVEGDLVHQGPHPDDRGRTVFVLDGRDVREPLMFR